jgi:hypothetical protein
MPSTRGYIQRHFAAIAFALLLILPHELLCQETILDKSFTFRSGSVKADNALDIISEKTGFSFTYDSRLVNPENRVQLDFREIPLRDILKSVFRNDSLVFSVINKYIVISRPDSQPEAQAEDGIKPGSVQGTIVDEDTGEPLAYATVGIRNRARGTVSNSLGEFVLNIPPEFWNDTLSISFLGYVGREIPVSQATGNDFTITMRRDYISIPEIIIRNQIPQEIILKARRAIPSNYGNSPALITGFYREGVLRKNELQTYSEAVLQIYKSAYSGSLQNDQIRIYRSRKLENLNKSDTLAVRLKAGLSTSLELDGARNLFDFISPGSIEYYSYRLADIVRYDDESAYAIEFRQREITTDFPLFSGTIYVNTSDFGIYKAEFEIPQSEISRVREAFVTSSAGGFNTWLESVKYSVSYRKVNGRYFLSHVRGDLVFNSRQKRKLFNTQFRVFFELAVTGIELENVKRFDREELAPVHSIFSKTISSYDREFWGTQDFLRPEENLMDALKNMKVKLQEFGE